MSDQEYMGKQSSDRTKERRKAASPNRERSTRRHSFNRAIRIDWDKVSFSPEEWEQDNTGEN